MLGRLLFNLASKMNETIKQMGRRFFRNEYLQKSANELEVLPRVFEYPFALRNWPQKGRVLEVGCTASSNILPIALAEKGYEVYGVDLRPFKAKSTNFGFIVCDARHLPFQEGCFDCVQSISTIEHIGLPSDLKGDSKAVREMIKVVKPNGSLIITVPFGKPDTLPDSRIYNAEEIKKLFADLRVCEEEYAIENNGIWFKTSHEKAAKADHRAGLRAVAMFKLSEQIGSEPQL